jgi:hypothetical protein
MKSDLWNYKYLATCSDNNTGRNMEDALENVVNRTALHTKSITSITQCYGSVNPLLRHFQTENLTTKNGISCSLIKQTFEEMYAYFCLLCFIFFLLYSSVYIARHIVSSCTAVDVKPADHLLVATCSTMNIKYGFTINCAYV